MPQGNARLATNPIRDYAARRRMGRTLSSRWFLAAGFGALLSSMGTLGCRWPWDAGQVPKPERLLASEGDSTAEDEPRQEPPPATRSTEVRASKDEPSHDSLAAKAEDDESENDDDEDDEIEEDDGRAPALVAARGSMPAASRYAALGRRRCESELRRRKIAFERVGEARGVVAPLRLKGPLSGVTFRSNLPAAKRRTSPYDIYDCRLVLALDDFAQILARHDIVEVVHLSVYRPVSRKTKLKGAGRRHGGALAIDAALFKTSEGRVLSVEKDFLPRRIGARPCPPPPSASELRKIACEAHDARLFNVLLTPNYNRAHRNHFHLEVTAGVRWTLVR